MEDFGWYWLVLALLNAILARRMNRSGMNWFVISLFVGPLATILIRVWPALPATGPVGWTEGQLVSGGVVAVIGAMACAGVAIALDDGQPLWAMSALYVVGAGVFTWLFVRERAERLGGMTARPSSQTGTP